MNLTFSGGEKPAKEPAVLMAPGLGLSLPLEGMSKPLLSREGGPAHWWRGLGGRSE
jgi:hypothetical protein